MARFPAAAVEEQQQSPVTMSSTSKQPASSSGPVSLLFSLEDGADGLQLLEPSLNEYDPVLEVQRIKQACTLSEPERKLAQAIQEAKASSILAHGCADLAHVGSYLRSKYGYLVCIRHANVAKRPKAYLRMLRHSYLVCRGLEGMEGVDVLVDLNFKDHFTLPHSTSWYAKLVAALPHDWIGTSAALAPLVGLMSAGIRLCFRQAGIPLPPWREGRAVLSKWVPEVYEEAALPIVPLPDLALRRLLAPYHTPFRTALRTAAAAGSTAHNADAAAGQRSDARLQGQGSSRPPLPRPPSGVALASASVKAAAADAAAGVLLAESHSGPAALPGVHAPAVVADVPRKIIVGFPDQHMLPAAQRLKRSSSNSTATGSAYTSDADAGVYLRRQQQQASKQQALEWLADSSTARPPAACASATSMIVCQAAQDATVHRGRHAGALKALAEPEAAAALPAVAQEAAAVAVGAVLAPLAAGRAATYNAANNSSTAAGCSAVVALAVAAADVKAGGKDQQPQQQQPQQQQPQQQQPQQQQPATRASRPAFTSTVGLVAATCGNSPAVVINRQLLQQQVDQRVAAAAGPLGAAPSSGDEVPQAALGSNSTVAAAAASGQLDGATRQFKTLDQLLPRMRTVRLGAA